VPLSYGPGKSEASGFRPVRHRPHLGNMWVIRVLSLHSDIDMCRRPRPAMIAR